MANVADIVFEEIECRSAVHRVQAANLPFRWALNPYRAGPHACGHCAEIEGVGDAATARGVPASRRTVRVALSGASRSPDVHAGRAPGYRRAARTLRPCAGGGGGSLPRPVAAGHVNPGTDATPSHVGEASRIVGRPRLFTPA